MSETLPRSVHTPVLLQEVIEYLAPTSGDKVFDGTLGGGGYTLAVHKIVGNSGLVIACDQDQSAIERFEAIERVELHRASFSKVATITAGRLIDGAVLDLGISSDQLEDKKRGISFSQSDAPLDMRMNASNQNNLTAWGILNSWEEKEIADMIYQYGEDRASRKIAKAIVDRRAYGEMESVGDLVNAIEEVLPRRGRTHPATKTFQALRIVVNDELGELERFLSCVGECIAPGGRVVIVSFHSLEDRIVKQHFRTWKQEGRGILLTSKPVRPNREEVKSNPRSRSATLRSFKFN